MSVLPPLLTGPLRRSKPAVTVVCGLGGGGPALAHAVIAELAGGSRPAGLARDPAVGADHYSWPGGRLVDFAAGSGLGNRPPQAAPAVTPPPDGTSVYLVRDRADADLLPASDLVDLTADADVGRELFRGLLVTAAGLDPDSAQAVTGAYGNATTLVPELAAGLAARPRRAGAGASGTDILELCRSSRLMRSLWDEVFEGPGRCLLDLGRVLCLLRPRQLTSGDLWARLASELSGQAYAVSAVSLCLSRYPALFATRRHGDTLTVSPSSPLAVTVLEGHVPPGRAEHARLYRVLRDIAAERLRAGHDPGAVLRTQLVHQAVAGAVLADLTADALAPLCCDPALLVAAIERDLDHLVGQAGAKAVLLCAHRLLEGTHPAGQLELSRRQLGLAQDGGARDGPGPRAWRTAWASPGFVHTHRLVLSGTSPALAVCSAQPRSRPPAGAVPGSLSESFCGCSDGRLWRLTAYGRPELLWHDDAYPAEIRAVAAAHTASGVFVGIGTSDHAVAVIDGRTGQVRWRDEDAHDEPVSAVAIAGPDSDPLLASAGVSSEIWLHRLDGGGRRPLYEHVNEIRGLAAQPIGDGEVLAFAAVDGAVGLIDTATGRLVGVSRALSDVLNGVDVRLDGDDLILAAGASSGQVVLFRCPLGPLVAVLSSPDPSPEPVAFSEPEPLTEFGSAVNCVRFVRHREQLAVISSSIDHTWRWTWLGTGMSASLAGHRGPVWSAAPVVEDGRLSVVTAGGEGDCRAWLADTVLAEDPPAGRDPGRRPGITSIALISGEDGHMSVVTGDDDGEVRRWLAGDVNAGGKLTQHAGQVSAVVCDRRDPGDEALRVVSGSLDGPLRLTEVRGPELPVSVILGIAHEGVTALCLLRGDGRTTLISGGLDGTLTAWDLDSRLPSGTVSACRYGAVQSLCATGSPSGAEFIVGGQDGSVALWDAAVMQPRHSHRLGASVLSLCPIPGTHRGWVAALADGRLAVAEHGGAAAGDIGYIDAHAGEARTVSGFMLAGRPVVASAGLDRRLRLFDLPTRAALLEVALDGYPLCTAARSPHLAVGSGTGAIMVEFANDLLTLTS